MAQKKPKSKSRRVVHSRKGNGDAVTTPAERLRATVSFIRDRGIVTPPNRLIGGTPAQTIAMCKSVIDWLAHIEQPFADGELAAAESHILHTVVDALEHAENETGKLWAAAQGMAASMPEVTNG